MTLPTVPLSEGSITFQQPYVILYFSLKLENAGSGKCCLFCNKKLISHCARQEASSSVIFKAQWEQEARGLLPLTALLLEVDGPCSTVNQGLLDHTGQALLWDLFAALENCHSCG